MPANELLQYRLSVHHEQAVLLFPDYLRCDLNNQLQVTAENKNFEFQIDDALCILQRRK